MRSQQIILFSPTKACEHGKKFINTQTTTVTTLDTHIPILSVSTLTPNKNKKYQTTSFKEIEKLI